MRPLRIVLALSGLVLALFGSQLASMFHSSKDVLVWVNGQPLTVQQLALAERRLLAASGRSLTAEQRSAVIELLIDEELMLQRAQSTGVFAADPAVRKAIVQAVIDKVVADFHSQPVSSEQLKYFYQQHQGVFERPPRVAIQAMRFATPADAQQAHSALLAGARFEDLGQTPAASPIAHLPSSPLPVHMLRRYLGNSLTEAALTLQQGEVSEPLTRPDGVYLLRARSVQQAAAQTFEQVRDRVEAEYDFRGRETALEQAVAGLWVRADIQINEQVAGEYKVPDKYNRELLLLAGSGNKDAGGDP